MRRFLVGLMAALAMFVARPADAQDDLANIQAYAAWTQQIGLFAQEAVNFVGVTQPAFELAATVEAGTQTEREALRELSRWRDGVDDQLNAFRRRGRTLEDGPSYILPGQEQSTALMRGMPDNILDTIETYIDDVEDYARDAIRGRDVDPLGFQAAQLALFQDYYLGIITLNRAARDGLDVIHPQRHLLSAMILNMESTNIVFELARQRMGAPASEYAVEDFQAALDTNQAGVVENIEEGRRRLAAFQQQLEGERAGASGVAARQLDVVLEMMGTYPTSFQAEVAGAEILSRALSIVTPVNNPASYDNFLANFSEYEAVRDQTQLQRQAIAARL